MSRQQKSITLPLLGAILLGLLVGVYLAASKHFSKPDPSIKITKHSVETPADETLKYWTANKMRHARPVPLPNVDALRREKRQQRHSPDDSSSSNA